MRRAWNSVRYVLSIVFPMVLFVGACIFLGWFAISIVQHSGASMFAADLPTVYDIPRSQALVLLGGESNNSRSYDPATGDPSYLVFSGLVTFNPQLQIVPDLAEAWDVSADGTVYTFHLRKNARFHDGRAVTTQDVIYSWERAADPKTASDTVVTYLGDIVGVAEKRAGQANTIRGLKLLDDSTLQVTIDAPKPYFLMKLTYSVAYVVDRANVESGADWYRRPNGTGPYKLTRWDAGKVQIFERFEQFYLPPPTIRYVIIQLYAGVGSRLYQTNQIDVAPISYLDVPRMRDPAEPMHKELLEQVNLCTNYIVFDTTKPPFDDVKMRQAFVLAIDKQRYLDMSYRGIGLAAHGLFPPALPGYNPDLHDMAYDPVLARQRLAESKYGAPAQMPTITFTHGGLGSYVAGSINALIDMWQTTLGVSIQVENVEPDKWSDLVHQGYHGQIFLYGWCADYPDPENFADALFHSGSAQNLGKYSNPTLDTLLDKARVERDVTQRLKMYQAAEQIIVDDAPALFLNHNISFVLVKPYVHGYQVTIGTVPLIRFLSTS